MNTFNDLPILDTTKEALAQLGLTEPTPIQAEAITKMIEGFDLIGQAQTGTGKTFAYAIPMVEKVRTNEHTIQGLILAPTRELTFQVYKEILKLVKFYPNLKVTTIVGGESYDKQFRELKRNPHIIVATPGRIIDHINRGTINLANLETLTLDEADEMLKMGFQEDIETILKTTPSSRQTVLFSATIPPFVKKIADKYQKDPIIIKIKSEGLTVGKITQGYYVVKEDDKPNLLIRVLDYDNPQTAIIFANTKKTVDKIAETLQANKYKAEALHGDLKQSQRNYVMSRFRNKELNFLIATDVAARGLDIDDVELIINYDIPQQDEVYVHRVGRTGRAGKKGRAHTFVTPRRVRTIEMLAKFIKAEINPLQIPTPDDIFNKRMYYFKRDVLESLETPVTNHLDLIKDIITDEESKDKLINMLLDKMVPSPKQYSEISAQSTKTDRTRTDRTRNERTTRSDRSSRTERTSRDGDRQNTRSQGKYVDFVINLGKKDGLNPQVLFRLLEKEYGIFSRNLGDIRHSNSETVFGLNASSVKRLNRDKPVNYKGKDVNIKNYKG